MSGLRLEAANPNQSVHISTTDMSKQVELDAALMRVIGPLSVDRKLFEEWPGREFLAP